MRSIAYVFTDPVEIQLIMQFLGNYPEFVFHSRAFADWVFEQIVLHSWIDF